MCEAKDFPPSERDDLMGLVTQLQGQVAQLTAANEELHEQVAELKRAGKRQAAPFSKGGRSSRPKRPVGSFSYRKSPSFTEQGRTCPGCGGRLEHEGVRVVRNRHSSVDGVPGADMPVPVLRQAGPRASRCCAGPVRGQRAPGRETSDGGGPRAPLWSGRSGTEGPRCAQSADWCGAEPGGDQPRRAATCQGLGDAYHKLRGSVRASPLVHTDDTGWRVDGGPAMAFETDEARVPGSCSSPQRRGTPWTMKG